MPISEPFGIAVLLTISGVLLLVSVLSSRASQRIGVPIALFFMVVGMLAGSEGIGGIPFADYRLACLSRQVSLITRREVMSGNAKFGSYGDGKELAQLAMSRAFRPGVPTASRRADCCSNGPERPTGCSRSRGSARCWSVS